MNKKYIAFLLSLVISAVSLPLNTSAENNNHTVVVVDFNGEIMETLTVPDGEKLDLSGIDTDSLNQHYDIYTQIAFNSWGNLPESGIVTEDIVVYALFRKMTISCNSYPNKTEYYSNKGNINLSGLDITITDYVQTPEKDNHGSFIVTEEVTNIESKCSTIPANLDEAFSEGKTSASVDVYPINSDIPIISYDITYFSGLGDINKNGSVESTDASSVLYYYTSAATGDTFDFSDNQKLRADVNRDGFINSADASDILSYYSQVSTSTTEISWDDFFESKSNYT